MATNPPTLEICSIAKCMEEANKHGQKVMCTMGNTNTAKRMEEANIHGQKVMCTMGSGMTKKSMEEALS
jgi:hypothetical protein